MRRERARPVGMDEREPVQETLLQTEKLHGLARAVDELEAQVQQGSRTHALIQRCLEQIRR